MVWLEFTVKNRIGYITLNRPDKRNALSFEMVSELRQAFAEAESNAEVKLIILKANGDAFCAGADLEHLQKLQGYSLQQNLDDSRHLKELFKTIYLLKKVVIAQVQGHALAGGCGLATVCDFVFAVPEAKFGYTEMKIGFIPAIVMVFLIRKIGEQKAKHLLLSGELLQGEAAVQAGLVNMIVLKENLEKVTEEFAQRLITRNSGQSMELTKRMIAEVQSMSLEEALEYASQMNAQARATDDCKKGIQAFLSKQELKW